MNFSKKIFLILVFFLPAISFADTLTLSHTGYAERSVYVQQFGLKYLNEKFLEINSRFLQDSANQKYRFQAIWTPQKTEPAGLYMEYFSNYNSYLSYYCQRVNLGYHYQLKQSLAPGKSYRLGLSFPVLVWERLCPLSLGAGFDAKMNFDSYYFFCNGFYANDTSFFDAQVGYKLNEQASFYYQYEFERQTISKYRTIKTGISFKIF